MLTKEPPELRNSPQKESRTPPWEAHRSDVRGCGHSSDVIACPLQGWRPSYGLHCASSLSDSVYYPRHSAVQVWVWCDSLKGQGEGGGSMLSTAPGLWWTLSNGEQPWLLLPLLEDHLVWRKRYLRTGSDRVLGDLSQPAQATGTNRWHKMRMKQETRPGVCPRALLTGG